MCASFTSPRFLQDYDTDDVDDDVPLVGRRLSRHSPKRKKSSRSRSSSVRGGGGSSTSVKGIRKTLRAAILDEDKEKLKKNVRELEANRQRLGDMLEAKRMRLMAADTKIEAEVARLKKCIAEIAELAAGRAKEATAAASAGPSASTAPPAGAAI